MRPWILALAVVMGSSPGGLGAQETVRDRAREALPPEVFRGVESLAAEAAREGIPQDPIFNKALEGVAKRVPADRLLPAVTAYAGRLRESMSAFGAGAPGPLVVAGADALQRGVEADLLRRLAQEGGEGGEAGGWGQGQGPSPVAVLVLADLVEAGVPAERALEVLQEAVRARTRDQQMLGIPGRVRQLMRQGQSANEAAEQVRRALQRGRGGGGGVGPPVPPGSEPLTEARRRAGQGRGGG